jgi:hypothetical protein
MIGVVAGDLFGAHLAGMHVEGGHDRGHTVAAVPELGPSLRVSQPRTGRPRNNLALPPGTARTEPEAPHGLTRPGFEPSSCTSPARRCSRHLDWACPACPEGDRHRRGRDRRRWPATPLLASQG